jgi:hypothetical protein
MKPLKKYPLFLVLLPLFIIVHIEKNYTHLINYKFVQKELLTLFIAPAIIYLVCRLLLKQVTRASLLSFIILFFFYFAGDIKDSLGKQFPGSAIQNYSLLLPLICMVILVSFLLLKRKEVSDKIIAYINFLALLLIVIDGISLIAKPAYSTDKTSVSFENNPCQDCKKPDIYYIIFDSYSSSALLKTEFNFDNSQIENYLREKGFNIISGSKSNYNLTPFSISSIFNMNYLPHVDTSHILHLKDYLPAVDKVYLSGLLPYLEQKDYKINNHSLFDFKGHKSSVIPFDIWKVNKIYQQFNIIKKTHNEIGWQLPSWVNLVLGDKNNYVANRDKHDSIALQHLMASIANKEPGPQFTYTHFFLPHSPYSFDSSGKKIEPRYQMTSEEDKQAYVQQIIYANKIMARIVDSITAQSNNNAIIIIQGDHGYRFFDPGKKQLEFPNFNAILLPGNDYRLFSDTMTSVNTFRTVFNTIFNSNYPILPAETYFLKYK